MKKQLNCVTNLSGSKTHLMFNSLLQYVNLST
uniref:Uncharacterized protein n=1 Tax=Arundo donax TaxID=35708 RepID=A0A0A9GMM0_ARUDO